MVLTALAGVEMSCRMIRLQRWRLTASLGIMAFLLVPICTLKRKAPVGYRDVARWLWLETGGREEAILVASRTDGEGMLISEFAQLAPRPALSIVRAMIAAIPARFVVLDEFKNVPEPAEVESVRRVVEQSPDEWILRHRQPAHSPRARSPGETRVYQRRGVPPGSAIVLRIDLRRTLRRFVERDTTRHMEN